MVKNDFFRSNAFILHYMILNFPKKIPKDYSNVIIGLDLIFSNFMIFSRHHNILEKIWKSVIPIISDHLTSRILFSVTCFTQFELVFQNLGYTAATLDIWRNICHYFWFFYLLFKKLVVEIVHKMSKNFK